MYVDKYEGSFIVLDFETTSIEYGTPMNPLNHMLLACWYDSRDGHYYSSWGEEWEQRKLCKAVEEVDFVVAQNAKFELGWLDRCGAELHDVQVWDTMLAEWVILGNRQLPKNLNAMLLRRGLKGKEDVVGGMIKLGISPASIPKGLLLTYCQEDVRGTLELFQKQKVEVEQSNQLHLVYSRCLLTPLLVDMEKQGIHLDKEAVEEEYRKAIEEYNNSEARLQEIADINFSSPKQVAELLYDYLGFEEVKDSSGKPVRTGTGSRSASAPTIASLRPRNKEQREFLDAYATLAKSKAKLTKTLNFFRLVCEDYDSVFYGIFNQGSTQTHRLSSSGRRLENKDGEEYTAQLQNMPREYKRLVTPRNKGWVIVEADGSQIEFRVAADMGHDPVATEEIANDEDIHSHTAKALTDAGEPTERQQAKPRTFRPLYGGTSGSKAEQAYCKFFQNKYKGIFATQSGWTHEVLRNKKLVTPYGMIFYWPDTKITGSGYITNSTSIFNYPVQGFATAEIVPIVLVSLWRKFRGKEIRLILTVHDSIVMEVGPSVDLEWLKQVIAEAFTIDVYDFLEEVYGYKFSVPLGCEIKIGDRWGSGKGIKAKAFPNDRKIIWSN